MGAIGEDRCQEGKAISEDRGEEQRVLMDLWQADYSRGRDFHLKPTKGAHYYGISSMHRRKMHFLKNFSQKLLTNAISCCIFAPAMQPDAALPLSSSLLPATGRIHIGRRATSVFDFLEQNTPPNGTSPAGSNPQTERWLLAQCWPRAQCWQKSER